MKALISPNETTVNPNTGEVLGARVCDIVDVVFEVAQPLFWVDCPDGVSGSTHFYDVSLSAFDVIPEYVAPIQPTTTGAQTL